MKKCIVLIIASILVSSCATKKEILYLQNADDYEGSSVLEGNIVVQPNDILDVQITAFPNEPAIPYNRIETGSGANNNNSNNNGNTLVEGYMVSKQGEIVLPILGSVEAKDKTTDQLQNHIEEILVNDGHLKNPVVIVRILNHKFSVLGEVGRPGTYRFYEENFTIFQALGMAGDLPINGKRNNLLLIREFQGVREVARIDITSADILESPYYLIKPNDFIYVEPNGPKIKSAGYIGNLGSLLSVFSILLSTTLILTR